MYPDRYMLWAADTDAMVHRYRGMPDISCPWIWGIGVPWDQGVQNGVHLAIFGPIYTIPIRARAYNDCVKDAVLLKTASNRGTYHPQNGCHFGGLEVARLTHDTCSMSISLYSVHVYTCGIIHPQNGVHFGGLTDAHLIMVPGSMIWGYFGVDLGYFWGPKTARFGVFGTSVHV